MYCKPLGATTLTISLSICQAAIAADATAAAILSPVPVPFLVAFSLLALSDKLAHLFY
jgi:hypothetical protein